MKKNNNTAWSEQDIIFLLKARQERRGYHYISTSLGRTKNACMSMLTVVNRLLRFKTQGFSGSELINMVRGETNSSVETLSAALAALEFLDSDNPETSAQQQTEEIVPKSINYNKAAQAIAEVDKAFDQLKEAVASAAVAITTYKLEQVSVEHQREVAELKKQLKEKDIALASYKTVVDAAKSNNLATSLKRRLLGG